MSRKSRRSALDRERARRTVAQVSAPPVAATRREAARTCGWCGGAIDVKPVGRIPTWCSASCRQRAWEQRRAAASGLAAVRVVERVVQGRRAPAPQRRSNWPALVNDLARELDAGRVYVRDLPELGDALAELVAAYRRRRSTSAITGRYRGWVAPEFRPSDSR